MAHVSSHLQVAVRDAGPVVVTVASKKRYAEDGNKRKKIDGEPFGRLTSCCITEESRVFLTDDEKNFIYEANIANLATVEVISKTFKSLKDVIFIREKPSFVSFVIALELADFICQAEKPLAQYSKISVDRLKQPLLVKEWKFGL